jgi:hypothetical protein
MYFSIHDNEIIIILVKNTKKLKKKYFESDKYKIIHRNKENGYYQNELR